MLRRRWTGLSPRVRGTGDAKHHSQIRHRFIPARAGNGLWPRAIGRQVAVHPRACGERYADPQNNAPTLGSSPRVRGTVDPLTCRYDGLRFIPARAGNGRPTTARRSRATVHPRACGERAACPSSSLRTSGSSPRVRGTGSTHRALTALHRFIPARAGNGPAWPFQGRPVPVHPRACGERLELRLSNISNCGSSPRVRGTATPDRCSGGKYRFIPARAGNGSTGEFKSY